MTSSIPWTKWRMYLALVLVCQTARRVQGHPRAFTKSQDAPSSSTRETWLSQLIETAYERQELLRPEQWSQRTDDHVVTRSLERDTSQPEYLNDWISTPGERKLLEAMNTDTSTRTNADEIVFPTDSRISSIPTSTSTAACHKNTFCENVADYPRQLVNAAIAQNASLRFLENVDPFNNMPDVEQRIDTTEVPLCRYREQVVYPQTAQNKEKQWLFIVNQDNLKQGIRIEERGSGVQHARGIRRGLQDQLQAEVYLSGIGGSRKQR
ncbi:uncharacterized protein [Anoplolepis gracilipes]|uniref:uncharacterized protein isoform X2 n=1 Tax=Anoplolepis gracilipes TaxID=354296 RepID=UPI003BA0C272